MKGKKEDALSVELSSAKSEGWSVGVLSLLHSQ